MIVLQLWKGDETITTAATGCTNISSRPKLVAMTQFVLLSCLDDSVYFIIALAMQRIGVVFESRIHPFTASVNE